MKYTRYTVTADPNIAEAVKALGTGALSKAFRDGCERALGVDTAKIDELRSELNSLSAKKEHAASKVDEWQQEVEGLVKKIEVLKVKIDTAGSVKKHNVADEKFELAVSEYLRCRDPIISGRNTLICRHLAGLLPYTSEREVRKFFEGRTWKTQPTEDEIRAFLDERKQ